MQKIKESATKNEEIAYAVIGQAMQYADLSSSCARKHMKSLEKKEKLESSVRVLTL